jgi:glyoxylase-like metal-dependent hydrolase (beta-lactamase superfamily II)
MIHSFAIGDVRVVNVVEYFGPTHDPSATFPEYDAARFAQDLGKLPPGQFYPEVNRLVIAIQLWLAFAADRIILIDAGVGNQKPRPAARMNKLNTLVPHWLAAAGATRENVTDVVMTHLHCDHVGWNTVLENGRWEPMFPNARYHAPENDFRYFEDLHRKGAALDTSFVDSVLPVLHAGLLNLIPDRGEVAGALTIEPAFGHTPGQLIYWLESKGECGVFSGDICHHPAQILNPGWNTAFCILPDEAKQTRAALLDRAASRGALMMPCHFPPPYCGAVRREGAGYRYEPARGEIRIQLKKDDP